MPKDQLRITYPRSESPKQNLFEDLQTPTEAKARLSQAAQLERPYNSAARLPVGGSHISQVLPSVLDNLRKRGQSR